MPDVLTSVWQRRLDVRVRRVAGKLALKGPSGTVTVPSGVTWVWTALDGRSTFSGLCERVGVPVERVTSAFRDLVDAGVVERVDTPPETPAQRVVVDVAGSCVVVAVARAPEVVEPRTPEEFEAFGRRGAEVVCADVEAAGARPTGCVVDLTLPADAPPEAVEWIRRGLRAELEARGATLAEGGVRTGPLELAGAAWGVGRVRGDAVS